MVAAVHGPSSERDLIRFGSFALYPGRRLLFEGEAPVHIGNRALDILLLLVGRAGEFVTNDEIVSRIWPRSVVVEGNLRVHIAALRKALGDGRDGRRFIVNVPNRGYQFSLEAIAEVAVHPAHPSDGRLAARTTLPVPLHRLIGRRSEMQTLAEQVQRHRLVTVVGTGGIGKTTVAVSVVSGLARDLSKTSWTSVHFIDLASLVEPRLVPQTIASSLGLMTAHDDVVPNLIAYLHDKQVLLLLDNCEHVISAAVQVIEAILQSAPGVHVLATSREPLRADGEWVQRLQALALPGPESQDSVEEVTSFGAIELFVERAVASLSHMAFTQADVPYAVEICRRLDGIPLAIELAAAQVVSLGYRGVATALSDSFSVLNKGRRTALPRQRTLEATLEWSYNLLSDREKSVLISLAIFAGSFSLEAACDVVASEEFSATDVVDIIAELAAKSLLAADVTGEDASFRLLDTMRNYAGQRLSSHARFAQLKRSHAAHLLAFMTDGERDWTATQTTAWVRKYGAVVDDVRAALAWAFSDAGDIELGVALTTKAAPMLFQVSLANEERQYVKQALDALAVLPGSHPTLEFELNILYGHVLFHTRGLHPDSDHAFARALSIAHNAGDRSKLTLAYSSNWMSAYTKGDPMLMREFASKFRALNLDVTDPALQLLNDRMQSPTLHFLGDQKGARLCAERSLATKSFVRSPFLSGAQIDRRVSMGCILVRSLWVLGLPLQADKVARETIDLAVHEGESIALAFILGFAAIPLAIASGSLAVARQRMDLALRHTAEHSLVGWRAYPLSYEPLLEWYERGCVGQPAEAQSIGLLERPPQLGELLAVLHSAYTDEATLKRLDGGRAGWCESELLRVRGERSADLHAAEAHFQHSLDIAASAEALTWELRTSMSIARLWARTDRPELAFERMDSVLSRVKEGFSTPDVRAAIDLYSSIGKTLGKLTKRFPEADDEQ